MAKKGSKKASKKKKTIAAPKRLIGIMHSGSRVNTDHNETRDAFKAALKAAGYDQSNLDTIGPEFAEDDVAELDRIASDMVNTERVEVLVAAGGTRSARAAEQATAASRTSVVFTSVREVNSYPSHMTGVCALTSALDPKRLGYVKMLGGSDIGVLRNPDRLDFAAEWQKLERRAQQLGVTLHPEDAPSSLPPGQINAKIRTAFGNFGRMPTLVMADPFFNNHRRKILDAAKRSRTPTMYQWRQFVDAGGLMSYGTKLLKAYELAGNYVGQILNGTSPADLPIEELTPELVINLKAAREIGVTVPPALIILADEVIPARSAARRSATKRSPAKKTRAKK